MLSHSHHPEMFTIVSMPTVSTPKCRCVCDVDCAGTNIAPNEKMRIHWPDEESWWDPSFKFIYNDEKGLILPHSTVMKLLIELSLCLVMSSGVF